jgi:hypothetical protein
MPRRPVARPVRATGQIFAVVDEPADAPEIIRRLTEAGVDATNASMLRGEEGAARIDATGTRSGVGARLRQILSFMLVDQMPDFALYEAAVLDGRTVLAVPITSEPARSAAIGVLRDAGAHFVNFYGRFATEEIVPWRGPELDIPSLLRR